MEGFLVIVALFEDDGFENLAPLVYTRPIFEFRSGMFSSLERVHKSYTESRILLFTRNYLKPTLKKRVTHPINETDNIDDETLLINGSLVLNKKTKQLINKKLTINTLVMQKGKLCLAYLSEDTTRNLAEELRKPLSAVTSKKLMKRCETFEASNLPLLIYPWDFVTKNAELIKEDYEYFEKKESEGTIDCQVTVLGNRENVYVCKGAFIEACATLDARKGPILVGKDAIVEACSRITGPTCIGNSTIISAGLIRQGCSIGPVCRVGGELEETIIQGYTNKNHAGFIGHAYIGEWVNMGAATTNSDLKNTYGNVRVIIKSKKVDTDQNKIGCFVGDHAKTSIGTQIYAGKKIGVASQVHGLIVKDVPSFTVWPESLGSKPVELYLRSAIETQKRMFSRRGIKQTKEDIKLLKVIFENTIRERNQVGVVKKKLVL